MALECLASLLSHIDSSRYMLPVMKSICSQLCNTQGSQSVKMWTGDDNLEILSNDIRESAEATPTDDSESDDEESVLLGECRIVGAVVAVGANEDRFYYVCFIGSVRLHSITHLDDFLN